MCAVWVFLTRHICSGSALLGVPWWLERLLSPQAVELCSFPADGSAGSHLDTHSLLECREGSMKQPWLKCPFPAVRVRPVSAK